MKGLLENRRVKAREDWDKGLAATVFSERVAYYLSELNALHPFREGNGRAQREFINHLAHINGYVIDWTGIEPTTMEQASIEAFHQRDITKLTTLIRDHLQQPLMP